eukprot:gene7894-12122_t
MDRAEAGLRTLQRCFEAADAVLVTAGAGWSACGGLPTYKDSSFYADNAGVREPLDYMEACRPHWALTEQGKSAVFKPFWTKCVQAYRSVGPHPGYAVLQRLLRGKGDGGYFVYTSNVDGHFLQAGFDRSAVAEVHGSVEEWQCCRPNQCSGAGSDALWRLPDGVDFVDACVHCGGAARPHVVMFADDDCVSTPFMGRDYQAWEDAMEAGGEGKRLVVLEFGCGKRVPALRDEGELVVRDFNAAHGAASATLFRVNTAAEDCHVDDEGLSDSVVPICFEHRVTRRIDAIIA